MSGVTRRCIVWKVFTRTIGGVSQPVAEQVDIQNTVSGTKQSMCTKSEPAKASGQPTYRARGVFWSRSAEYNATVLATVSAFWKVPTNRPGKMPSSDSMTFGRKVVPL